RQTLKINQKDRLKLITDIEIPEELKLDVVLIQLPKSRKLIRRWLLQAFQALKEEGILYLAGANKSGIQSAFKDAQDLFASGQVLGYKKGHRATRLVKQPVRATLPGWTEEPGIAPGTWMEFSTTLFGRTLSIRSLPGVFSYDHLDPATQMLLAAVKIPPGARVLDVGCGYGIIGMCAACQGASWVDLVDSDLLAVAAAKETLMANDIQQACVFTGDLLAPLAQNKYDLILSNPPFHTGLAVDYQIAEAMIGQSFLALNPGGRLIIVANRFIPYHRLIEQLFGNVSTIAESGRFHVLSGLKS
ncbi:MAG: methyltransferase, partial [Acidobacteriaceae bacterium]